MTVMATTDIIREALEHCLDCPYFESTKKPLIEFALQKIKEFQRKRYSKY